MAQKSIELSWIVVADVKKAVKFFTEVVGLKLLTFDEKYGWAELQGATGGSMLGIAQEDEHSPVAPGSNAVVTITVDDIQKAKKDMEANGAKMIGDIMEVPEEVKLQMFADQDGNKFQLCEMIRKK